MSETDRSISEHYGKAGLYDRILAALAAEGIPQAQITADHLKPIDEFHIGGLSATEALLEPLDLGPRTRLLDVGSGIGGAARHIAERYGAQVTGLDLTPEFVETAQRLTALTGPDITFVQGSALDMPFETDSFDVVTLLHVGMNLPDKPRFFSEAARILHAGGILAIYDVMRFGEHPDFPLPWAATPDHSFLDTPEAYLDAARAAGFRLETRTDRGEVAKAFFARMQAQIAEHGPPRLGLPMLMGDTAGDKAANMARSVEAGDIQPVEITFRKG
ncbi:Methyltransferase domain-containing protein [Jannaschia faecimaris]|uniref:Methyltransferase domain-containing protein n=1 Tax=Jannaschia faecimaris TaxID=1244108 RepID=A0A1H3REL5_9RHOB|nr:class I SAM-dependent methyltransferase [Jannaschia faecimaris]SDZ23389.1 Methyltransferase domain-containing protein [Jannaschia faecimaris]